MNHDHQEGFSAAVRIRLEADGRTIPLSETGVVPKRSRIGYAVPCEPQEFSVGTVGTLIVRIDGRELRWGIVLDENVVPFDKRFNYRITEYPGEPCLFQT